MGALPVPVSTDQLHREIEQLRDLMVAGFASSQALDVERDRRYEERFEAQEKAVLKAEADAEAWRRSANEWRAAMSDREAKFVQGIQFDGLASRVGVLERRANTGEGRGLGLNAALGYLIGIVGLAATIIATVVVLAR